MRTPPEFESQTALANVVAALQESEAALGRVAALLQELQEFEGKTAFALVMALLKELSDAAIIGPHALEAVLSNAQAASGDAGVKSLIDAIRAASDWSRTEAMGGST